MRPRVRKPWSTQSLHRHLLNLLDRPTTQLHARALRGDVAANVDFDDYFPPAYVKINVDLNNPDRVQYVIHELKHVVLSELVWGKFDETLEEVITVALDTHMYEYVKRSKARLARWEKLIEQKLAETAPPDRPISEITER